MNRNIISFTLWSCLLCRNNWSIEQEMSLSTNSSKIAINVWIVLGRLNDKLRTQLCALPSYSTFPCGIKVSAFLASAAGCNDLLIQILPNRLKDTTPPYILEVCSEWKQGHQQPPVPTPMKQHQRAWETPHIEATQQELLCSGPQGSS